jgi:hypothetical protein
LGEVGQEVRSLMASVSQMLVMGAIVATLLYCPVGLALVLVLALFGVSFGAVVTFGGALNTLAGLFAWWLLVFAGACVYAALAFPWGDKALAWPRK